MSYHRATEGIFKNLDTLYMEAKDQKPVHKISNEGSMKCYTILWGWALACKKLMKTN
jgi:hypothetical protein